MQDAAIAALHLLFRALIITISKMGTSVLALGIGLAYPLVRLFLAHRRGGWATVKSQAAGDTKWGALFTLAAWFVLLMWFTVATIYQDHVAARNAIGAATRRTAELEQVLSTGGAVFQQEIDSLKVQVEVRGNTIEKLKNQIEDQQTTIANFIAQTGKSILPEPFKINVLLHPMWPNNRIDPDIAKKPLEMAATEVIVLVNRAVPGPWQAVIATDQTLLRDPDIWVLGASHLMSGGGQSNGTAAYLHADSPRITPSNPLIVTLYSKQNVSKVSFGFR